MRAFGRFEKWVVGLSSHALNYIHTGIGVKSVCIYDAETGEVVGRITPSYLSMILAEVEKVQTEPVH